MGQASSCPAVSFNSNGSLQDAGRRVRSLGHSSNNEARAAFRNDIPTALFYPTVNITRFDLQVTLIDTKVATDTFV